MKTAWLWGALLVGSLAAITGCAGGRPSVIPNPDAGLRKTSVEFAADAVKRHPYKSDAPKGGEAVAAAQVGYWMNRLEIVNLSGETWQEVEVWVNRNWVVMVPKMEPKQLKRLNFEMLYDDSGHYFPVDNNKVRITDVTIYHDGKMYDVPWQLAD